MFSSQMKDNILCLIDNTNIITVNYRESIKVELKFLQKNLYLENLHDAKS